MGLMPAIPPPSSSDLSLDPRRERLRAILSRMDGVLVALSGGVDSALVTRVAHDVLGDRAVALTAVSPTFPSEELEEARRLTAEIGIRHVLVDSNELESEGYAQNAGDRCYFCKSELFDLAVRRAGQLGLGVVADGTIVDDLGGHRPGLSAASEHLVRHPLVEAGFDKAAVRTFAKSLGLTVWGKPSFACLGSRFPVGTRVTADRVGRIGRIETHLRTIGLTQFRARWHSIDHSEMVRIEVAPADIETVAKPGIREAIVDVCKAEGFGVVTLDLQGYGTR
jgi:uncharacterized protein